MRLIALNSSNIAAVGYDIAEQVLYAQFNNGSFYKYLDVDPSTVVGVLFDPVSQGKAFNTRVKDMGYVYEALDAATVEQMRV